MAALTSGLHEDGPQHPPPSIAAFAYRLLTSAMVTSSVLPRLSMFLPFDLNQRLVFDAAVLLEEAHEGRHVPEVRDVVDVPAFASRGEEPRPLEKREMEGGGRRRQGQPRRHIARGQAGETATDEQPEDREARLVGQRAQHR